MSKKKIYAWLLFPLNTSSMNILKVLIDAAKLATNRNRSVASGQNIEQNALFLIN
jgi:hypothetical protein